MFQTGREQSNERGGTARGSDDDAISALGASHVEILGGNVIYTPGDEDPPLPVIAALESSTIRIYGHDFNYPLGKISDSSGVIRGVLADGETFEWSFTTDATAAIYLVPEPATRLMLVLAGMALAPILVARLRRRAKYSAG